VWLPLIEKIPATLPACLATSKVKWFVGHQIFVKPKAFPLYLTKTV
jgi:hypothetical protein